MDPLRLLVLVVVGTISLGGIAYSVYGIVVELRYRKEHRRASASQGPPSVGADIDSALTATTGTPAGRATAAIVAEWTAGRSCALCGRSLDEPAAVSRRVALLDPGGTTSEWSDFSAERLPLALATCLPVCWHCHTAETFRRLHPELVTDRDEGTTRPKNI